ncbi:PAS domain S-box-containing protein/diguanylate cyclase (GGDEF)-like protein [Paenibacillus taihuensis]|uniref:PAS domain S-box-containing protein/diguanylate cyclase (GGDEF)-like protein n=1 Tax=Paenibacillus taihuensis TaxID=1156355 RepID=A0A3D9RHR5_9BACL|nr:EAL domain-containing protein [Paenibacillus taihuensis]REE78658.1 PAS domain S-box-containing protein/diguanylate cyclase (GGDEF)-like protein [Paenibacillus taihuensis]
MTKIALISESKKRCEQLGIDPQGIPSFTNFYSEDELNVKRAEYEEILSVINFFVHKMLELMKGIPLLILISDENGCILEMAGDEAIKSVVQQSGIQVGLVFNEQEAGTNSINLVLDSRQPIQLVGAEHYYEFLGSSACYSVPFQYTDISNLLGTITIMTTIDQHNPFLLAMLCTVVDSIERELLLKKQNKRLHILNQVVIETTRNGIIITDRDGAVTEFNKFAEIITGSKKQDVINKPILDDKTNNFIKEVLHTGQDYEDMELVLRSQMGQDELVCLFDAFPIRDENMQIMGAFAQFRDITERYHTQKQINYLAYHDDLTGLPNRRFFTAHIEELLSCRVNENSIFAVMFLDLDSFKKINDTLGHNNGDILLKLVAERLKACCHAPNQLVSRMGGDEFTILLEEMTDHNEAIHVAEEIIQAFEKPFAVDGYEFYITASIGIAFYPQDGRNVEMLMKNADIALYRMKDDGKNNYTIFKPIPNSGIERLTLENSIRKALQLNEFVLYYQPKIDTLTGQIIGTEALVRWNHPTLGLIPPGKFIPIAEETGLIVPLGEWVLRTACSQNKIWKEKGYPPMSVSVNLSSRQFSKHNLVESIKEILLETRIDPQYLELEITESMTMNVEVAIEVLGRLKELGIQICIDDFGTGYSNLYYLKLFSIDRLKIDQSFVRDIMTDSNDANIVATIIAMAHNLGIDVIAEGVETKEQLDFLRSQGCHEVQGFYYHPPLPAEQIEQLLLKTLSMKPTSQR